MRRSVHWRSRPSAASAALFVICLASLAWLAGCQPSQSTAAGTARAFIDAHYVRIDLAESKQFCSGLALSKVEKEIELTADVAIEADTLRPRITYGLSEEQASNDRVTYAVKLKIRPPGMDPFERSATVSVRRGEAGWSVSNYNDGGL